MTTTTYGLPAGGALSLELAHLVYRAVRAVESMIKRHEMRAVVRELESFDDRMLADIGISRGDISNAVLNGR